MIWIANLNQRGLERRLWKFFSRMEQMQIGLEEVKKKLNDLFEK